MINELINTNVLCECFRGKKTCFPNIFFVFVAVCIHILDDDIRSNTIPSCPEKSYGQISSVYYFQNSCHYKIKYAFLQIGRVLIIKKEKVYAFICIYFFVFTCMYKNVQGISKFLTRPRLHACGA